MTYLDSIHVGDPCLCCGRAIRADDDGTPMTWGGSCSPACSNGAAAIRAVLAWLRAPGDTDGANYYDRDHSGMPSVLADAIERGEWRLTP